jgi:uncharacterized protein Yka (UPF0111/DUF47 family)
MIFSKGKKSVDLISDHIDMVAQCIRTAERAVESYIDGNLSESTDLALQAYSLERDANHKMDEITMQLCQGGGLAPTRGDHFELASSLNRAAEGAATCSIFFLDRRPEIPQPFRAIFIKLTKSVFEGYSVIKRDAVNCLKGGWNKGKDCDSIQKFGSIREEMKINCRDLYRRISEIEDAPWQQITLDNCMNSIIGVFDRMVLTADTITRINLRLGN